MKPGSLVIMSGFPPPKACGIIISKSKIPVSVVNGKPYQLWDVLCYNKIIVEAVIWLKLVE